MKWGARKSKFNAVKTVVDGITFDSKREAVRYGELKLLDRAGKIRNLVVHPRYSLVVNGTLIANYKPDFYYKYVHSGITDNQGVPYWHPVVEDVKSPPTARKRDFVLVKKLMKAIHGIEVEVIS